LSETEPLYYGTQYIDRGRGGREYNIQINSHQYILNILLAARRDFAYGEQLDYLNHPDVIGWTRLGNSEHPKAMAVIISDGPGGSKWMNVGKVGKEFKDLTGHFQQSIFSNENGWAEFYCDGGSVAVWVES
jgi:alpha-amylase